jgi:hypothetical protein
MSDLGPEAGALVHAAREEAGLSPGERMRLRASVLSAAHAGMLSAAGTAAATTAAAKTFGLSTMVWVALAGSLSAAGAGAYYVSSRAPARVPAVAATITSAPAVVPTADRPEVQREPEPATAPGVAARTAGAPATKTRALEGSRPAPAASVDTHFSEDARLLRDVRSALASGQNERALALLDARGADESAGVFAQEREAARIVTLCKLGRQAEARAAARRFLAAHGGSPLAERVRSSCPAERDEAPR